MSEPAQGGTLLRVGPAAFLTTVSLVCGPLMLFGGTLVAFGVPGSRGTGILMILLGFGFTAMAIRGTRQRAVMIEVTERGIFFDASTDVSFSLLRDLFLPWERLESMRFLTRRQIIDEGLLVVVGRGFAKPGCIALKLRTDALWPPSGTLRRGMVMRRGKPGEIYLLTSNCSPGGWQLWEQMTAIVTQYGGRDIVVAADQMGDHKG
jgi:hypothetical protein